MKTWIIGNIGNKELELKYTSKGAQHLDLSIYETRGYKDKDTGEWVEKDPLVHKVVLWNDLAEQAYQSLQSGQRVIVFAKPVQEKVETTGGWKANYTTWIGLEIGLSLKFGVYDQIQDMEYDDQSTYQPVQ